MIEVTLKWVADQLQATLQGEEGVDDHVISGVSTDTRTLQLGDLFIALVGPNFNGHKFVQTAQEKGAVALLVSELVDSSLPQILVEDTKLALGQLGAAVKAKVAPKTVGITGSAGKTTVKEMTAAILSRRGKVMATKGNFNNDIGVPLTLLELEEDDEYAVVEMGANHLGEIAYTTKLVQPDTATIVNASAAHLEGFGSLLGVARAKSEIFKGLGDKGVAILNADSQFYKFWAGKLHHCKVQSFSQDNDTDYHASDVAIGIDGCANFELHTPIGKTWVQLTLPGIHNVSNALVAAALAINVGASLEDIRSGLQNMNQVNGRLNVKTLSGQVKVIDDTYNASVASVHAAIDLLSTFSGHQVLVLGDMAELGEKARYYHEQVGEYAKEKGVNTLYTLGVLSQSASEVFAGHGAHFSDRESLVETLVQALWQEQRDITILVKGSRSAAMEKVVELLEGSELGKFERSRERIAC